MKNIMYPKWKILILNKILSALRHGFYVRVITEEIKYDSTTLKGEKLLWNSAPHDLKGLEGPPLSTAIKKRT